MKSTDNRYDVLIAGAGITGLTLGWHLSRKGMSVKIADVQNEPGGAMKTCLEGEWLAECGPGSLLVSSEHITNLITEIGLDDEVVRSLPDANRRYLVKDSRPRSVPASLIQAIRTPLLSGGSKIKALREPFVRRKKSNDESLADFVRRRLGGEFLDQFINPLVGGIYAGDPEQLSVRYGFPRLQALEDQHGSIFKGQFRGVKKDPIRKEIPRNKAEIISFRQGIQQLARKLAGEFNGDLSYNTKLENLSRTDDAFQVDFNKEGDYETVTAGKVILTMPLYSLKNMSLLNGDERLNKLSEIPYAPVSVINLGYKRVDVGHPLDGFGVLIPKKEPYRILGVQFNSSVFPGRAPDDRVMLTVFLGGMRYPNLVEKSNKEQLDIAQSDLRRLLDITGEAEFRKITNWPRAIPQYEVGYSKYLNLFEELETDWPGFHLAGNFRGGISVGDCITNATLLANKIAGEAVNR